MRDSTKQLVLVGCVALGTSLMAVTAPPKSIWEWVQLVAACSVNVGNALRALYNSSVTDERQAKIEAAKPPEAKP